MQLGMQRPRMDFVRRMGAIAWPPISTVASYQPSFAIGEDLNPAEPCTLIMPATAGEVRPLYAGGEFVGDGNAGLLLNAPIVLDISEQWELESKFKIATGPLANDLYFFSADTLQGGRTQGSIRIFSGGSTLNVYYSGNSQVTVGAMGAYFDNQWHVMRFKNLGDGNAEVYIDDILKFTPSFPTATSFTFQVMLARDGHTTALPVGTQIAYQKLTRSGSIEGLWSLESSNQSGTDGHTQAYDISGNGIHANFLNLDTSVNFGRTSDFTSRLNQTGYNLDGSGFPIPAQLADPTKDALGSALVYTGQANLYSELHSFPVPEFDGNMSANFGTISVVNAIAGGAFSFASVFSGVATGANQFIFSAGGWATTGFALYIKATSGNISLRIRGGGASTYDSSFIADGEEHTVLMTRDASGNIDVYVDGVNVLTGINNTADLSTVDKTIVIGASSSNSYIMGGGVIDNCWILSRVATTQEIEEYSCCGSVPDDKIFHAPATDYLSSYLIDVVSGISGIVSNYDESIFWAGRSKMAWWNLIMGFDFSKATYDDWTIGSSYPADSFSGNAEGFVISDAGTVNAPRFLSGDIGGILVGDKLKVEFDIQFPEAVFPSGLGFAMASGQTGPARTDAMTAPVSGHVSGILTCISNSAISSLLRGITSTPGSAYTVIMTNFKIYRVNENDAVVGAQRPANNLGHIPGTSDLVSNPGCKTAPGSINIVYGALNVVNNGDNVVL